LHKLNRMVDAQNPKHQLLMNKTSVATNRDYIRNMPNSIFICTGAPTLKNKIFVT